MHRDTITHLVVTLTDFIITKSEVLEETGRVFQALLVSFGVHNRNERQLQRGSFVCYFS